MQNERKSRTRVLGESAVITQVGKVRIEYFKPRDVRDYRLNPSKRPYFKDGRIHMPNDHRYRMELLPGESGDNSREFLAFEIVQRHTCFGGFGPVFYGGERNGRPFLYELSIHTKKVYEEGGPGALFGFLKPDRIAKLQNLFPTGRSLYLGDLRGAQVEWDIPTTAALLRIFAGRNMKCKGVHKQQVLSTRHRISGRYQELREHGTAWAIAVDSVLYGDCGERKALSGTWVLERIRHTGTF